MRARVVSAGKNVRRVRARRERVVSAYREDTGTRRLPDQFVRAVTLVLDLTRDVRVVLVAAVRRARELHHNVGAALGTDVAEHVGGGEVEAVLPLLVCDATQGQCSLWQPRARRVGLPRLHQ